MSTHRHLSSLLARRAPRPHLDPERMAAAVAPTAGPGPLITLKAHGPDARIRRARR